MNVNPNTSPDRIRKIPLDLIDVPDDRLRALDPDWADGLAQSMSINGLQSPVMVAEDKKGRYTLIAGLHRLTAAQRLEWGEIDAHVFTGTRLQQRLLEIDENLIRRELSPLDKASHLAERQRIYEELYPETKRGAAGAAARWADANEKSSLASFSADVAERLGMTQRAIQISIARHNNIAADVRAQIALTWIADKGVELDALAKLEPSLQRKAVTMLLNGDAKSVKQAAADLKGIRPAPTSAEDAEYDRLMADWRRAGARARQRFVEELIRRGDIADIRRAA